MKKLILNLFQRRNFLKFQTIRFLSSTKNDDNMSKKSFWNKFYKQHSNENFEWLLEFNDSLKSLVANIQSVNNGEKITLLLDVGCGTSKFSHDLKKSMNTNFLLCSDFSYEALDLLKSKSKLQTIDYVQCDCKYLPYRDNLFDLIIDKGFSDSLLKETNAQKSTQLTIKSIENQLEKVQQNGVIIQITDEEPELRIASLFDQLKDIEYTFKEIELDSGANYFVYFLNKKIE